MTECTAYFRGRALDQSRPTAEQLKALGVETSVIERLEELAYRDHCCNDFADVNYARPVIDYGDARILHYEALMPYLDGSEMKHRWEKWESCPFCGTHLCRSLKDKE